MDDTLQNPPVPSSAPAAAAPTLDAIVESRIKNPTPMPDMNTDPAIDAIVKRKSKVDDARVSINTSITNNPDEYSKYVRLSKQTGMDPELLMHDAGARETAESAKKIAKIDIDNLAKTNPKTVAFLSDPVNASVAYDDTESMSAIEKTYAAVDTLFKTLRGVASGATTKTVSAGAAAMASPFGIIHSLIEKPISDYASANADALNQNPIATLPTRIAASVADMNMAGKVEDYLLGKSQQVDSYSDNLSGRTGKEGLAASSMISGGESAGQAIPAIIGSIYARNPEFMLNWLSGLTYGQSYDQARQKELDPLRSSFFAAIQGKVEKITETVPVGQLLKPGIFKDNLAKNFINFQIKEGGSEQVATAWQDFNEWAMLNPDKPFKAYLDERPNAALATAIATTIAGGGQVAAVKFADRFTSSQVKDTKAFFDALTNGLNESKLQKRLPEKTKEFINNLTKDGDVKNVYIDANEFTKYFQSKELDPSQAAEEILGPEGAKQLTEAQLSGGDLVVPLGDYASKVATSEHHAGLAKDLRLRQGDLSERQAEEQANEPVAEPDLQAMAEQVDNTLADHISAIPIYDDIYNQAIAIGVPPSQADTWATIESSRYRARAARLGVAPAQLWADEGGLQIAREGLDVPGSTQYNQNGRLNQTQTPAFRGWFGDSKVKDANGEPLVVYHGTVNDFNSFDASRGGESTQGVNANQGMFFTSSPGMAGTYANIAQLENMSGARNVMPVYLSLANPLRLSAPNMKTADLMMKDELLPEHDGAIVDVGGHQVVYMVRDPKQIKSAIGNNGNFDPNDANILYQSNKNPFPNTVVKDVVYHGSQNGNLKNFRKNAYFTDDPGVASSFADRSAYDETLSPDDSPNVIPAYINLVNPKIIESYDEYENEFLDVNVDQSKWKSQGYDGMLFDNGKHTYYLVFDPNVQVKSAITGEFMQKERGMVQLGEKFRRITLLENADPSTFIHELGHTWLEELQRDANRADAPQSVVEDWDIIRNWLGIENGPIPVEAHEQFARGTEAYFMEGNAPSPVLRRVFAKVKAWLKSVYQQMTELNVRLNPKVREVFDRMIALDEEIDRARALNGYVQMFSTPEEAGMTEAEFDAYTDAGAEAIRAGREQLTESVAAELAREQANEWRENRRLIKEEVKAQAAQNPVYQATWLMSRGETIDGIKSEPMKLNKDAVVAMMGEDALKALTPAKLKTSGWIYANEGGVHPDTVAKMFGFRNGKKLIQSIIDTPAMTTFVDATTDRLMRERFGDPMDPGQLAVKADDVVHNERQADLLAIELKALRKKKAEVDAVNKTLNSAQRRADRQARAVVAAPIPVGVLKEVAFNEISKTVVNELNPQAYLYAEARASKESMKHALKGEYSEAAEAKQRQILNFYLFQEATRVKKEVNGIVKHAYNLTKDSARKRIGLAGQEWLQQLDSILDRYSFATMPAIQKARSLVEWAKSVEERTGEIMALAPGVLDEANRTAYKELTVDELRAVHDTLLSISHVAKKITQVMRNGKAYEFKEITAELASSVRANIASNPMPETDKALSTAARISKMTAGFFNTNLRPEKIIERMDGGKSGIWHDLFFNQAVDAQNYRDDLRMEIMKPLLDLNETLDARGQRERMNEGVEIKSIDQTVSRRTLVGVALNVGNDSNRNKLQEGGMWFGDKHVKISDETLAEMLDSLNQDEWQLVQTMWDAVDKLYPHLDALNRRAIGLPLERVQPKPLTTKFGVLNGGYWPAAADPRHSKVGEQQESSDALITGLFGGRYPKAATAHSFRNERTEAVYPLQLDWERVLSNHVHKAITDIAYHEWVKQARRLLENQEVKKSIQNTLGEEIYRSLEEWLVHQVIPLHGGYSANQSVDTLSNTLLSNTVIAALGFKAATAIGNLVVAPVQASHQVRPDYIVRGLTKFISSPLKSISSVHALSGEMRHRFEHYEQTFNNVLHQLEGKHTLRANIARWSMAVHLHVDRLMSTALWQGKYQQEIDAGKSAEEAMRLSDKMIRTSQTAGAPKDLSSFERDPRYRIFKMFIGPMIIMQNEMRGSVAGKGAKAFISPEVWGTMLATWIIPSMLFELAVGRGPGDDEDWYDWALRKTLLYPAQTVPFVREAATAAEAAITGREAQSRSNPISDTLISVVRSVDRAMSDSADMGDITKAFARSIGALVGLPTGQAIISGQFLVDVANGDYTPEEIQDLRYLFVRREE